MPATCATATNSERMTTPNLHTYNIGTRARAFSTTRHGGVSMGEYASMNVNEFCGDSPEAVATNRKALAEALSLKVCRLVIPHQVHGVECREVAEEFFALPESVRRMLLEGVDAVMTRASGACIGVSTADCIPVLLYDEVHHAAAAIHAGWRGTVQRIVAKTVAEMRVHFGTQAADLKAVIGPGISGKNYEVGEEVVAAFEQAAFDLSEVLEGECDNWHINLPVCNRLQLIECGVRKQNIHEANICTFDHNADFFSARRQGIQSGRIYTAIILD